MIKKRLQNSQIEEIINLTIKKNEQLCIYGMNGSGKTMLIKKLVKKKKRENQIINTDFKDMIKYAYQLGIEKHINKKRNILSSGQKKKLIFMKLIM